LECGLKHFIEFCSSIIIYLIEKIVKISHAIFILFICTDINVEAQFSSTITTIPYLPNGIVTTGYTELQVISVFDPLEFSYCRWRYLDQSLMRTVELFSPGNLDCEDRDATPNFPLFCVESEGIINSTLILMFPLQTNFMVFVECALSVIAAYEILTSTNVIVTSK